MACRCRRPANHLAIDQPMQQVQHMGLGGHARSQGHFHSHQHGLFIVMQNQRQNVDHLADPHRSWRSI